MANGTTQTFTTDSIFSVTTGAVDSIGTDSVTINGNVVDLGGAKSATCYFEYRQAGSSTWKQTSEKTVSSPTTVTTTVPSLTPDTDYDIRFAASASDGDTDTGSTKVLTTDFESASVTTNAPSEIDETGAVLNGTLDSLGSYSTVSAYFEYRTVGASSWSTTSKQSLTSGGSFSVDVTGLDADTQYEYRAVAVEDDTSTTTSKTGETKTGTT